MASTLDFNEDEVHSSKPDHSANKPVRQQEQDGDQHMDVQSSASQDLESYVMSEADLGLEDDQDGCCPCSCFAKSQGYHFHGDPNEAGNVHVNLAYSGDTESVHLESVMDLNNYRDWFEVLCKDNSKRFDKLMRKANEVKKKLLINGRFKFNIPHIISRQATKKANQQYERPLCLAAACGSKEVFLKLLKEDVCVTARDKHGCNVVHVLVMAAAECPGLEKEYFTMYNLLLDNVDRDTLRGLLLGETLQGHRPLELAAKLGAFGIFRVILETPSFYGKIVCQVGACTFYKYNLSDYEETANKKRYFRSPIRYIANMPEEHVASYVKHKIHEIPVMETWMRKKYLANFALLILWFFLNFLYVFMCTILDPNAVTVYVSCMLNSTSYAECTTNSNWLVISTTAAILAGAYSVVIVLFDLFDLIICRCCKREQRMADIDRGRNKFVNRWLFRVCRHLLALSTITTLLVAYLYTGDDKFRAGLVCKGVMLPFMVIEVFHVLENIPFFGTFVFVVQRVILLTVKYLLFLVILQVMFALYFHNAMHGFIPSVSGTKYQIKGFETILSSIYTTFLLTTNSAVATTIDDIAFTFPCYIYMVLNILLLINFLAVVMIEISKLELARFPLRKDIRNLLLALTIEEHFGSCVQRNKCAGKNTGYFIVATYIKDREYKDQHLSRSAGFKPETDSGTIADK